MFALGPEGPSPKICQYKNPIAQQPLVGIISGTEFPIFGYLELSMYVVAVSAVCSKLLPSRS